MRTDCVVVPGLAIRRPNGRIRALAGPPLEITPDEGPSREERVRTICAALAEALARSIRRFPDNWLWLHNRWVSTG